MELLPNSTLSLGTIPQYRRGGAKISQLPICFCRLEVFGQHKKQWKLVSLRQVVVDL